jgi:hypothetical protein
MAFADEMQAMVLELATELGNSCTLEKRVKGQYDPATGRTSEVVTTFNTYSVAISDINIPFALGGENTNLAGFGRESTLIPWMGEPIDETWTYNGENINTVSPIKSQNMVIAYTITVGKAP